jgi:hypothetical protein
VSPRRPRGNRLPRTSSSVFCPLSNKPTGLADLPKRRLRCDHCRRLVHPIKWSGNLIWPTHYLPGPPG